MITEKANKTIAEEIQHLRQTTLNSKSLREPFKNEKLKEIKKKRVHNNCSRRSTS